MKKTYATEAEILEVINENNMIPIEKFPGWYINEECVSLHVQKNGYRLFDWKEERYTGHQNGRGYQNVHMNGKTVRLNSLMGMLFVDRPKDWDPRTWDCHHIDGNRLNNVASNLKWISRSEHMRLHHLKKKEN